MVPGIASRPGQAVNEDDTNATKKSSVMEVTTKVSPRGMHILNRGSRNIRWLMKLLQPIL